MPLEKIKLNKKSFTHRKAIVFIHGLNGSKHTWIGDDDRWVDNFMKEESIINTFDLYIFSYPTKTFDPFSFWKKLFSIIPGRKRQRPKFNTNLFKIAEVFKSGIDIDLLNYGNIIIIAHSMGGLIAKKMICLATSQLKQRISLFASLSVPHMGSGLANIGAALIKNPQLTDLKRFGRFTEELNTDYRLLEYIPRIIYQKGIMDKVVEGQAAIPPNVNDLDTIVTDDDHYSILSIRQDGNNKAYKRILNEIIQLRDEWTDIYRLNTPVNVVFEENILFRSAVAVLLDDGITFEFNNFSEDQLNAPLRAGNIEAQNTIAAVKRLRFLSIENGKIPKYKIKIENNHLQIIKQI